MLPFVKIDGLLYACFYSFVLKLIAYST
ncbi:hypothetical protein O95_01446, partial [Bartonella henselae JK 53]